MQIKRIEIDGSAGHVAIERGHGTIRIDSILAEPRGRQAIKTWEIPARTGDDELLAIAREVQVRCDGAPGTSSMIQDYYRELQRFAD